jgi:hypothetical protein
VNPGRRLGGPPRDGRHRWAKSRKRSGAGARTGKSASARSHCGRAIPLHRTRKRFVGVTPRIRRTLRGEPGRTGPSAATRLKGGLVSRHPARKLTAAVKTYEAEVGSILGGVLSPEEQLPDTLRATAVHGVVCFTGMLSNNWTVAPPTFPPTCFRPTSTRSRPAASASRSTARPRSTRSPRRRHGAREGDGQARRPPVTRRPSAEMPTGLSKQPSSTWRTTS